MDNDLSTKEARVFLSLSRQCVFYHVEQGRLHVTGVRGGSSYFERDEVVDLKVHLAVYHNNRRIAGLLRRGSGRG